MGWSFDSVLVEGLEATEVAELAMSWLAGSGARPEVESGELGWDAVTSDPVISVCASGRHILLGAGFLPAPTEALASALATRATGVIHAMQESTSGTAAVTVFRSHELVREVWWGPHGIESEAGPPQPFEAEWRSATTEQDRLDWAEEYNYVAEIHGAEPKTADDAPGTQLGLEDAATYLELLGIDLWAHRNARCVEVIRAN